MTPSEIMTALSKGHDRRPGDALEAAASQRSEVSALLLEKLAQVVAEIENLHAEMAHDAELLVESTYEEFQEDLEYAVAHPDAPCRPGDELQAFAGVQELESWVET